MPNLPFWKAYDMIMHNVNLSPSQKLPLIVITSNWPRFFNPTNFNLTDYTSLCRRQIQYNLKAISTGPTKRIDQGLDPRRAYIKRGYIHEPRHGKPFTVRWFKILSFPSRTNAKPPWAPAPKWILSHPNLRPAQKLYLIEHRRYAPEPYPYTLRELAHGIGLPFSYTKWLRWSLRSVP